MPKSELNAKQRVLYDMLDHAASMGDPLETARAIEEWVNDNFQLESGDLQMDGPDDWWVENQELGWK